MLPGAKEEAFGARVYEILGGLAEQYPSLSVTVDLWRPTIVSQMASEYSDDKAEVWVRLDEAVPAFFIETMERWYEVGVGLVRENYNYVILPGDYNLEPDDHIIMENTAWMVVASADQAGIAKLRVDKTKSRFKNPPRLISRATQTYRQCTLRALIT